MIEVGLEPTEFEEVLKLFGRSNAGIALTDVGNSDVDVGKLAGNLESASFEPKLGVLVETGIDDSLRLGGNFSSLLDGKFGLKVDDGVLASGGSVVGKKLPSDGVPL